MRGEEGETVSGAVPESRLLGPTCNVEFAPPVAGGIKVGQQGNAPVAVLYEPCPGKKNLAGAVECFLFSVSHAASLAS